MAEPEECSNCGSVMVDGLCPHCDAVCGHCGKDNFNCDCPTDNDVSPLAR